MKGKLAKPLCTSLTAMLLLSMFMVFPASSTPNPYISVVNPGPASWPDKWTAGVALTGSPVARGAGTENFTFYTNETVVDETFFMNITVTDVDLLDLWQVRVVYDPTLLDFVESRLPPDHVFAECGATIVSPPPTEGPNYVQLGATFTPYGWTFNGSGTLCQLRFQIIGSTPDPTTTPFNCGLTLDTAMTYLYHQDIPEEIPATEEDGFYEFIWAAPVTVPCFQVHPPTAPVYRCPDNETIFSVDIKVRKVAEGWNIIGFQFALMYNSSLLEFLGWDPDFADDMANNATWLDGFCEGNETTLYVKEHDFHDVDPYLPTCYSKIASCAMIIPDPDLGYIGTFPNTVDKVTLVSFQFKAIAQGIFPEVLSCWLNITQDVDPTRPDYDPLSPIVILDKWQGEVDYQFPPVNAKYEMEPKILGRSIDVFVGSECTPYPYPYGGQGINATADMFYPQKKVCMWAEVLYNLWPEQNKVVTFEVRWPDDTVLTVLTAVTNETGIAFASFRIPWPEAEPFLCDTFIIVASVDIACEVVKDWLWFHFDYLVRWVTVTTDKVEYAHCETVYIHVEWMSKAMQEYPAVITVVIHDELQVPVGMGDILYTSVRDAVWCEYNYYYADFTIHIHKHAHAGTATIYVNALNCLPWDCGFAWVPQYAPAPTIAILAA